MDALVDKIPIVEQNRRIAQIIAEQGARLRSFIRRRVPDHSDAEDIAQEVFSELVEANRLLMPVEHLTGWLYRVARNRITDLFRKKRPEALEDLLPSADAGPDALYLRGVLLDELAEALAELPEEQREVFVAHEFDGRSFKDRFCAAASIDAQCGDRNSDRQRRDRAGGIQRIHRRLRQRQCGSGARYQRLFRSAWRSREWTEFLYDSAIPAFGYKAAARWSVVRAGTVAQVARTYPMTGALGFAYSVNATVVPQGSLGFLTLWNAGAVRPVVSTLNAVDGAITSNAAIVLDGAGYIQAYTTDSTHLILDVNGLFRPF